MGITVRTPDGDLSVEREYARRTGLPLRSLPAYRGTAIGWQNHLLRDGSAFVVELKAGPAPVKRHVDAVLALARRYAR
jgi:protein MpaA